MLEWLPSSVRALERSVLREFKTVLEADSPGSTGANRVNVMLQLWATALTARGLEPPQQHASARGAHWSGKLLVAADSDARLAWTVYVCVCVCVCE